MTYSLKSLIGFAMGATDGEIGAVKDFYFDDCTWSIRYIIVETGSWLNGRRVLISPATLLPFDWDKGIFPVNLTREQIENSPDIDTAKPVSRQMEIDLQMHYRYAAYWEPSFYGGGMSLPVYLPDSQETEPARNVDEDWHLRSSDQVKGYVIKASDGEIGSLEDFLLHSSGGNIEFLVVDTGHWLPGKKVVICPKLIKEINWKTSVITVHASTEQVKNSPEYNHGQPFSEGDAMTLDNYYGEFVTHVE
jgi:uncharacterized protein YrrD